MVPAPFPRLLERGGPDDAVTLDPSRALLAFHRPYDREAVARVLSSTAMAVEDELPDGGAVNHTERRLWVRALSGGIDDGELGRLAAALGEELAWIGPVYGRFPGGSDGGADEALDGLHCPCPDTVLVRFAGDGDTGPAGRAAVVEPLGLMEDDDDRATADRIGSGAFRRYHVAVAAGRAASTPEVGGGPTDAYDAARRLRAVEWDGGPAEVRFENMPLRLPYAMQGTDPLCPEQWNMVRIHAASPAAGQVSGWDYSTGDSSVIVAVLDTGCDLTHPDLRLADGLSVNDPEGHGATRTVPGYVEGHGTMCAGVAAAVANNLKGLQGVAGRCVILPVAFQNGTDWEFLTALTWAADHGAQVASMSFSIYGEAWDLAVAGQAVTYAASKDMVLCAAAGNADRSTVGYPASDGRVIAVGASTRSTPEQRIAKGTTFEWGSNYGPNLSVMAPGTGIPTTCIEGNGDGGVWGTRYVAGFYGTSAATPHVAGLAALIRTVRPGLDATGVRRLIESTADKVGSDPFDQRLANGTWNKYVGYGRINVQRALRRAIWPFDIMVSLRRHLDWLQMAVKAHWAEIEQLEAGGGDPALVGLHRAFIELATQPAVADLLHAVATEPDETLAEMAADPMGAAERWGVKLPAGSEVLVGGARHGWAGSPTFEVRFSVEGCAVRAGWDAEAGFFGEVEPRELARARRQARTSAP